jgi:hypothetical protein
MANKLILRKQKSPYTGDFADTTKSKTLSISELDNNQIYLKGLNIITGSTSGTDIILDKLNGDQITIDLSAFSGGTVDVDYGNIIFVSEVGDTGSTRSEIIGDINKPVDLNWASVIAQSGDTIHVKAGVYNYDPSIATGNTLSVTGVNHYFEAGAKVYNNTNRALFVKDPAINYGAATEGNVYGSGSFYTTNNYTYSHIFYDGSFDTDFSTMSVFEFDECTSVSTGDMFYVGVSGAPRGIIIKGKNRIVSYSGSCMYFSTTSATKITVDCPQIISEAPGKRTIITGTGGGSAGDLIINSNIISSYGTGGAESSISIVGSAGRVICNASYIKSISAFGIPTRVLDITAGRIDSAMIQANLINLNAHVGDLKLYAHSIANVTLCDRFLIAGIIDESSVANICMSNILYDTTGTTSTNTSFGTLNLSTVDVDVYGTEIPNTYTSYTSGSKEYLISGIKGKTNLIGNWDNGDTITTNNTNILNVNNNAHIKNTTINVHGGTLEVLGKTDDTQINYTGGTVMMNGATMVVSDQNKQIITTPNSGTTVKVYSGGLNTNKFGPFSGSTERVKVDVSGTGAVVTVNSETFTSTTGTTSSESAAELLALINASGTVNATASQDTLGTDTYIYIESDIIGTALVLSYGTNTAFNSTIKLNSNPTTEIVGGMVIIDSQIT